MRDAWRGVKIFWWMLAFTAYSAAVVSPSYAVGLVVLVVMAPFMALGYMSMSVNVQVDALEKFVDIHINTFGASKWWRRKFASLVLDTKALRVTR